ncbi:MAG: D-glycerate dehydrogenase [Pseudomonadota bacterium]
MKLLFTRPMPAPVLEAAHAFADVEMRDSNVPMTVGELKASMWLFDAIIPTLGDACQAGMMEGRCKLLANFGVGYNHIDVAAAKEAGIAVTNTPGAVTDATADIALMLMLMSCRRAGEGERMVRAGDWGGWHPTQMLGLHMSGKTVGIVGMGRIGQAIARRCHFGFGMDVVFYNRSQKDAGLPARQTETLAECMAAADVVVLAIPGGAETRHMINAEALAAMQPHAHLVNIARGDVMDEAALIAALDAGQIAGAGLDVYEFEPKVPEALVARENVVLLPHLGTAALEVRTSMGLMAVNNVKAFADGVDLPNPV